MKKTIKNPLKFCSLGLLLVPGLASYNAGAANVFWDNNGTSAATSGTWDTTSTKWSLSSALTASTVTYTNGNFPEFAAGSSSISALTITVSGPVTCAGMATGLAGATVTNLTFTGPGPITISSGLQGFFCGPSTADGITCRVPLIGSGGIKQSSSGYLALYTNNSYTGGTTLTGGQLVYYNNNSSFGTGAISVTASANALVSSASTAMTIPNNITFSAANFNINLAGGLPVGGNPGTTFTGTVTLPSSGMTTLNTGGSPTGMLIELSGVVSGSSGVIVADNGTLELGGVNTYTGGTAITSPAVLSIVGSGSLGSGSYSGNLTNNSRFIYNSSANQTLGGVVSGSGQLFQKGSGTLTLSGVNTYSGATTITAGTLTVGGAGKLGNGTYTANITNNDTLVYGSSAAQSWNGVISGTGSLSVAGSAQLTLGGANTYSGGTTISSGLLAIGSEGNLGTAPSTPVANSITISSGTNGNNGLRSQGTTVSLNANRGITLNGGGQIQVAGNDTLTYNGIITGDGGFENGTSVTVGYGTLVLGGSNTYTGPTILAAGTIKLGTNGALPSGTPLVISSDQSVGAVFNMNGFSQIIGPLSSSTGIGGTGTKVPTLNLSGDLTVLETNDTAFNGVISGSGGSLTLQGTNTLTLNWTNTYSGPTIISSGTLSLGSSGAISNSASISIAAGATYDVSGIPAYSLSSHTALSGSGTATPAVLNGAVSGTVDLGSQPITLAYDGTDPALIVSNSALVLNGNAVTVNGSTLPLGTYPLIQVASGNVTTNGIPTVTGTVFGAGTSGMISVSGGTVNLVVLPAPTFSNLTAIPSITYGASSITLSGTLSGSGPVYPNSGETVTVTINGQAVSGTINDNTGDFTIVYNDPSLATDGVSNSPFAITYGYAGNGTLGPASDNSSSLTVTPSPLSVTAGSLTKIYGQTLALGAGSASFTSSGLLNGETIGTVTLASSGGDPTASVSGSPYALTPSAATGGTFNPANYSIVYNDGTLAVTPAPLAVAADNYSRVYGATNPPFTVTYSNFVNGQTLVTSDVVGSPVLASVDTNADADSYVITNAIGTLASTNYTFSLVNGVLTVTNALSTNVVTASTNPALPGAAVVFAATLSTVAPSLAVPTNAVQFVIDGTNYGAAVYPEDGVATITNASLLHGYHTIEADYNGDTNVLGGTNILGSTNTFSALINTPPVAGLASFVRPRGTSLHIAISDLLTNATDADGDVLSLLSLDTSSTNGATVMTSGGIITYVPASTNADVTDAFNYSVADTYGATNSGTVLITIMPDNTGPALNITGLATNPDGSVSINFAGIPNYTYLIEATTDLTPPITWTILSTNQAGTNGLFQYTDLSATNYPTRYYRTATPQ